MGNTPVGESGLLCDRTLEMPGVPELMVLNFSVLSLVWGKGVDSSLQRSRKAFDLRTKLTLIIPKSAKICLNFTTPLSLKMASGDRLSPTGLGSADEPLLHITRAKIWKRTRH